MYIRRLYLIVLKLKNTKGYSIIHQWLASKNMQAFRFQEETWQHIINGKSGLVNAPTGCGKTFSVFLGSIIQFINEHPDEARKYLLKNTLTPDDIVDTVPLVKFTMVSELNQKDVADFQKFIDFSTKTGVLPEKVDVTKYLQKF